MVLSEPIQALGINKTAKDAANCIELHLAERRITRLAGFEIFCNLEVLWINNNEIKQLNHLEDNFRLRELYCYNNKINTLKGSLLSMKFLKKLIINNNCLEDLHSSLKLLSQMKHLKHLDMYDNPLSEEADYRLHIIDKLPWLEVLDQHTITDEEREAAKKLKTAETGDNKLPDINSLPPGTPASNLKSTNETGAGQMGGGTSTTSSIAQNKIQYNKLKESIEKNKDFLFGGNSERRRTVEQDYQLEFLKKIVKNIKKMVKARRICMKHDFMDIDRRKEEKVTEKDFLRVLELYNLKPIDGCQILLAFYSCPPPQRCRTLGRDIKITTAPFIDYVSFCSDVEPKGGLDMDHIARELQNKWNERVPEISASVRRLEKEMGVVQAIKKKMEEDEWKAKALALEKAHREHKKFHNPWKIKNSESDMLNAWEFRELKNLMSKNDETNTGFINIERVIQAFNDMELYGRKYNINGEPFNNDEFITIISYFKESDENSNKIAWKDLWADMEGLNGKTKTIRWRKMTPREADNKSKQLFQEAKELEHEIALSQASQEEIALQRNRVHVLTHYANRLEAQASHGKLIARQKAKRSPAMNRRDMIRSTNYMPQPHAFERSESLPLMHQYSRQSSFEDDAEKQQIAKFKRSFSLTDEMIAAKELKKKLSNTENRKPYKTTLNII